MYAIHTGSIILGIILGFFAGTGIAFLSTWLVEKQMEKEDGSPFERGFDKGYERGKEHAELLYYKENK